MEKDILERINDLAKGPYVAKYIKRTQALLKEACKEISYLRDAPKTEKDQYGNNRKA